MSVPQQATRLVQKSLKQHIIGLLTAESWPSPSDFVDIGYVNAENDERPLVGIPPPSVIATKLEVGSGVRRGTYLVDIDVIGKTETQLTDIMDIIAVNVNNVRIIDFNVKETNEVGYDPVTQTISRGQIEGEVRRNILDPIDYSGRVSFRLRENNPLS